MMGQAGMMNNVDSCSGYYKAGQAAGMASGFAGIAKSLAKMGVPCGPGRLKRNGGPLF